MLVGDRFGRFLQPLGVAHFIDTDPTADSSLGKMSVAAAESGELWAFAIDSGSSRVFIDSYPASPESLLPELCRAASRKTTEDEWRTYFPNERYEPVCRADYRRCADIRVPSDAAKRKRAVRRGPALSARSRVAECGTVVESQLKCPLLLR
jgi:hypothetical protein